MDRRGGLPRRPARAAPGCRTRAAPRRPPEGLFGPALGRGRAERERPRAARDRARREPERRAPRGRGGWRGRGARRGRDQSREPPQRPPRPRPRPRPGCCARRRTQLPRNDAPLSGSLGPRPALKGRAPPLGACAELSASPGDREAGWGRGMGAGRLSQ